MKIVVIGGTAAGLSAAAKAKRNMSKADIVVYEKSGYISYGSCGLPYFVGDKVKQVDELLGFTPTELQEERGITAHVLCEVTEIDPENKSVTVKNLKTGEIFTDEYDKLVIATGANVIVPPFCKEELSGVHFLRLVEDGIALKQSALRAKKHAVVVGGGFIGLEITEQLTELGLSVTIVDPNERLLRALPEEYSELIADKLVENGVTVKFGNYVSGLVGASGHIKAVVLDNGEELPAEVVVISVGIRPNTKLATDIGVKTTEGGAILVNRHMETNLPDIYACGDCATTTHQVTNADVYSPMGTTANKQGKICGDNLVGIKTKFNGVLGSAVTRVFDLFICYTGLNLKAAIDAGYDAVAVSIVNPDRAGYFHSGKENHLTAVFDRKTGQLYGAQGVGSEGVCGRMNVFVSAITAKMTVVEINELDLLYTPSMAPVYDPILILMQQAVKKLL